MSRSKPNTKLNQLISGYKLQHELDGQRLEDLVLDSPDGKLYYQVQAKDLNGNNDPSTVCDLWQTANKDLTVRIRRKDGRVDTICYQSDD